MWLSANSSMPSHCLGVITPPGRRQRIMTFFKPSNFLFVAFGADVAVVLFVHAVKADKLEVVAVEAACQAVVQVFGNRAAQVAALAFEPFVVGKRGIGKFGARVGCGTHGVPCNHAGSGCHHCNQAV